MELRIEDLKSAPYNPRRITPEALEGLRASLKKFGDISGLVWNRRTGHLVAGHQRLESLKALHGDSLRIVGGAIVTPAGERFPLRVVDWDAVTEQAANIAANSPQLTGVFTEQLDNVLVSIEKDLAEFDELRFDELVAERGERMEEEVTLQPRPIPRPPRMAWVLIGIPTVQFGTISGQVESIARLPDAVVETTLGDGEE